MPLWRRAGHRHKRRQPCSSMKRQQKITFREMRASGVRGVLIYCSDYKCSHWTAISADPKSKVVQTAPDSGRIVLPWASGDSPWTSWSDFTSRPLRWASCSSPQWPCSDELGWLSDFRCSHWTAISADRWADDARLSDIEPRFTCQACGTKGADVRPD
jgi:hypothetical protein